MKRYYFRIIVFALDAYFISYSSLEENRGCMVACLDRGEGDVEAVALPEEEDVVDTSREVMLVATASALQATTVATVATPETKGKQE
jgi:hypothetical protein